MAGVTVTQAASPTFSMQEIVGDYGGGKGMRWRELVLGLTLLIAAAGGGMGAAAASPPAQTGVHGRIPAVAHTTQPVLAALHVMAAAFPTARDGYIAGTHTSGKHAAGFVEGTSDGGKTWHPLALLPGIAFHSLTFQNAQRGLAVAEPASLQQISTGPQQLFQTVNGGRTWTPVGTVPGVISSVVVAPSGTAWISVSQACNRRACPPGAVLEQVGSGLATVWNAPGPVLSLARHGSQMTAEVAVITAKSLTVRLYTRSHGTTWTAGGSIAGFPWFNGVSTGSPPAAGQLLWTSANHGLASVYSMATCAMHGCGVTQVSATNNGGASWTPTKRVNISCQFGPLLAGGDGEVAVAQGVGLAACAGPETQVFVSPDGGVHFPSRTRFPETPLENLGIGGGGLIWGVTGKSVIVSHDGGRRWSQIFPAPTPTGPISAVSQRLAYGAGDQSNPAAILRSVNGGSTWQVVGSLGPREAAAIAFLGTRRGWIGAVPVQGEFQTSQALLHTTNGALHWSAAWSAAKPGTPTFAALRFFAQGRGVWLDISDDCAGACGAFGASTNNGGRTWHALSSPQVPPITMSAAILSPRTFIVITLDVAGGPSGMYKTTNAGKTWHEILSMPYDRFNGNFALSFPTARVGYLVVNDVKSPGAGAQSQRSVLALLKTTNGGRSWSVIDLPHIPDDWYASVSFSNPRDGFLSADDTLWKTTDGGRSWTEMP